ncbi:hypothetical protein AVEN_229947-1 [Araneus ventricosus]|uniref:MD-2-related lipid-recognition domain-containing protein n=1 Tax=Araneus ventricosus TaxID=182803 RepID=A0A4Y2BYF4_ARAVE|nr:hypothetical protein AVEN_229947-1 [Araneus ventricosus]
MLRKKRQYRHRNGDDCVTSIFSDVSKIGTVLADSGTDDQILTFKGLRKNPNHYKENNLSGSYPLKKLLTMASIILFLCIAFLAPAFAHGSATFADCGGADKSIAFKDGSVKPDPVQYPGNLSMTVAMEVLKTLPASDFEMKLDLIKLDPRRMSVPCLDNIGSCTYDICEMIENHRSEFCPMFPNPTRLRMSNSLIFLMKDAPVAIPDFGEVFVKILEEINPLANIYLFIKTLSVIRQPTDSFLEEAVVGGWPKMMKFKAL